MSSVVSLLQPAPLPPEVEALMGAEARRAQVTTMRIRLGVGAVGLLALIPNWSANAAVTMWVTLALGLTYTLYALVALLAAQKDRGGGWLPAVTVSLDVLVVAATSATSLTNHAGAYEALLAPVFPLLTMLMLSLTALQYSVRVALWGALLASSLRLGLLLWCVGAGLVQVSDEAVYGERVIVMTDQVTLVFVMLLTGVVAAWIAHSSRTLVRRSAEETIHTQQLERAQAQYRRYMSGNVLDYVLSHPEAMALGGSRRAATVMFVDIRNFTAFADRSSPEQVVEFLNGTFSEFVDVVFKHGGTLDKFLGDGLLAVFGVPREMPDASTSAVKAALEMLERVKALNGRRKDLDHELRIGIGIAHGVVVAGNIGSEARMEYTVVGDTVNFAARLQDLTKDLNCSIVVSESVYDAVRGLAPLKRLPPVRVRGKAGEVQLWGLPNEARAEGVAAPVQVRSGPELRHEGTRPTEVG